MTISIRIAVQMLFPTPVMTVSDHIALALAVKTRRFSTIWRGEDVLVFPSCSSPCPCPLRARTPRQMMPPARSRLLRVADASHGLGSPHKQYTARHRDLHSSPAQCALSYDMALCRQYPDLVQSPYPPIYIGGESKAALGPPGRATWDGWPAEPERTRDNFQIATALFFPRRLIRRSRGLRSRRRR